MNVPLNRSTAAEVDDQVLIDLVDEIANQVQAGLPVDVEAYLAAHPVHADRLRQLLPAVEVLADLGRSAAGGELTGLPPGKDLDPEQGRLGDFRIIHSKHCRINSRKISVTSSKICLYRSSTRRSHCAESYCINFWNNFLHHKLACSLYKDTSTSFSVIH